MIAPKDSRPITVRFIVEGDAEELLPELQRLGPKGVRTAATVQLTDEARNSTKPQPDIGRFSATSVAPAMPVAVPSHLRNIIPNYNPGRSVREIRHLW